MKLRTVLFGLLALGAAHPVLAAPFNANDPASTGYALTFADDFDKIDTIDVGGTCKPGYKWYAKPFFGGKATPTEDISVRKGVLTLNGPDGYNASIATAAPDKSENGYLGTVFTGGYFEASIAFDPKLIDVKHGFPSFWAMAIEHMALKGQSQWPGQEQGFEHFIEVDFFEANTAVKAGPATYSGAVHDWYGKWTRETGIPGNIMNRNYIVDVPHGTDWNKFHRYGCLVVPATAESRWQGYIQYYFDGLPTGDIVAWTGSPNTGTPPPAGDSRWSITDTAHLNVILGCGNGNKMRVDYVRVWQPAGQHDGK